jgi:hypothetical protein
LPANAKLGNPYSRGRLSAVDLELTSLDQLIFILKILFTFLQKLDLNEEVN